MKHTAAEILAISLTEPERLFMAPETVKDEHKRLSKAWHPDLNADPLAADVTAHINVLRDKAEEKIAAGRWEPPGMLQIKGVDNKTRMITFKKKHAFELGEMVYGHKALAFIVRPEFGDLFKTAVRTISSFRYRDAAMRQEMERFLPKARSSFEAVDGRHVLVLQKTPDVFLLRDVLGALGGKLDARHVAWVLNATYNIACYLQHAGLTHNAISIDTLFVSPEHHSGLLLGGWWYAAAAGKSLTALPATVHRTAPPHMLRERKADPALDLALVRIMGRQLLGDITGMLPSTAPPEFTSFLRHPASSRAVDEYRAWNGALAACFGKRRFLKLEIAESAIFN